MLREFISYYRPHKGLFWLDFGCSVLSGLLELAFPLAVTAFIDHLLPQGDWTLTLAAAAGLLALYAVNAGLLVVVVYWGHKLGINIETEMRARAFDHLTRLSWRWYDRARTGRLSYAVKSRIVAFAAIQRSVDTLVFAGGIGEDAPRSTNGSATH